VPAQAFVAEFCPKDKSTLVQSAIETCRHQVGGRLSTILQCFLTWKMLESAWKYEDLSLKKFPL
jgi:hypothetical protein